MDSAEYHDFPMNSCGEYEYYSSLFRINEEKIGSLDICNHEIGSSECKNTTQIDTIWTQTNKKDGENYCPKVVGFDLGKTHMNNFYSSIGHRNGKQLYLFSKIVLTFCEKKNVLKP